MKNRLLRRLGLVPYSLVLAAVADTDREQGMDLPPGVCTAWAVMTYIDERRR